MNKVIIISSGLIICNLLAATQIYGQIKIYFTDKATHESVADVQVVTVDRRVYFSDQNGIAVLPFSSQLPFQISRVGYSEQKIDTLKSYEINIELSGNSQMNQVDVFSEKESLLKQSYGESNSINKNIDRLKEKGISGSKEVFQSFSELQIKDYGGESGFQTFSARGTTASQNSVVIDGMVVNDMTSGIANLSLIPISAFRNISVQTGGFSADVANGGFGSTVYLESNSANENEVKLNYSKGSFGTYKLGASLKKSEENKTWFFQTQAKTSEGNFDYDFQYSGKTEKRNRLNNLDKEVSLSGGINLTFNNWKFTSLLLTSLQKQGVPGPVFIDNEFNSDSQLNLKDIKNIMSATIISNESIIRFSSLIKFQQYDFVEKKGSSSTTQTDFYKEKEVALRSDYLTEYKSINWNSGLYFRYNNFSSNQLNKNIDRSLTDRLSLALFTSLNRELNYGFSNKLSMRLETANELPSVLSASYLLAYTKNKMEYSVSVSRMQRYPSFTELHFVSLGNPKLVPEKYLGIDLATKYQTDFVSVQIKGFCYVINDKIISVPKNEVQWSTQNLDEVKGFGLEQNVAGTISDLNYEESISYQSARNFRTASLQTDGKYLIYTPTISSTFSVDYLYRNFSPFVLLRYTGEQFYSAENLNSEKIKAFWILNSGLNYKTDVERIQFTVQFQVKNILDQKYEWVKSYPQPGRYFEATIEVSL